MTESNQKRDILDVSAPAGDRTTYPAENLPNQPAERPTVSPQEGGYFLNKFLAQSERKDAGDTDPAEAGTGSLQERIIAALQEIYDPEIPVNIYELGLIYGIDVRDDGMVTITMTLTTPHCPVAESMPGEVELKVNSVPGVNGSEVKLVWDPPWDMSKMTDEARLELGLL